jgi:uncharacterized membrane protein YgdD (TMEM256/DUF423 family)
MQSAGRRFCLFAALLLALATVIGALSAHALKPRLSLDSYGVLQTAVHYQFFHALGLMAIGLLSDRLPAQLVRLAGWLVLIGVLLFSGSLYLLVAGAPRVLGLLTPIGGLALIAGWCMLALALTHKRAP